MRSRSRASDPDARAAKEQESRGEASGARSAYSSLLALQGAAGNAAVSRLLQRFPEAADIDNFWSNLKDRVAAECGDVHGLDCREASNRLASIGQSKAKQRGIKANRNALSGPLYRISDDDLNATATEVKEAYGRAWRVRDRVVSAFGRDFMKVFSGGAEGAQPTVHFYPLLPGMMIYSAEDAGWKDKGKGTYRWYLRHAAVYAGGGWVRENFGAQRRNIKQGDPDEDKRGGAYGLSDKPKFLTTLAIYDPFHAYRSKEEEAWVSKGPLSGLQAAVGAAASWFPSP